MHRVLPSPKRGFPGSKPPGIVWLIPTLTEHTYLPAIKASIALTHQASKSCADYDYLAYPLVISDVAKGVAALLDEPLTNPAFADIYRWRYALPVKKEDAQLLNELTLPFELAFCGDAFVGGGIHLALEHGIAVACQLISTR
jgi:predicted NAD/FAD-dependent oxidoreductase